MPARRKQQEKKKRPLNVRTLEMIKAEEEAKAVANRKKAEEDAKAALKQKKAEEEAKAAQKQRKAEERKATLAPQGTVTLTRTDAQIAAERTGNSNSVSNNLSVNVNVPAIPPPRARRSRSPSRDRARQRKDEADRKSRTDRKRSRSRSRSESREDGELRPRRTSPRRSSPLRRVSTKPQRSYRQEQLDVPPTARIQRLENTVSQLVGALDSTRARVTRQDDIITRQEKEIVRLVQNDHTHEAKQREFEIAQRTGVVKRQITEAIAEATIDIRDFCVDASPSIFISSNALVDATHTIALLLALGEIDRKFRKFYVVVSGDGNLMRRAKVRKIFDEVETFFNTNDKKNVLKVLKMITARFERNTCDCCNKAVDDLTTAHVHRARDLVNLSNQYKASRSGIHAHIEDDFGTKTDLKAMSTEKMAFINIEASTDANVYRSTDNQQKNARDKGFPSVLSLRIDQTDLNDINAVIIGEEKYELQTFTSRQLRKMLEQQGMQLLSKKTPVASLTAPPVSPSVPAAASSSSTSEESSVSSRTPSYPSSRKSRNWANENNIVLPKTKTDVDRLLEEDD